jgi:hypothetical protein
MIYWKMAESACRCVGHFDEAMIDLFRFLPDIDTTQIRAEGQERRRFSHAPEPLGKRSWPILRMNALSVTRPTNCGKVICEIGGSKDLREAVDAASANLIVARTRLGVIGFGSDDEFRRVLDPFSISEFGIATFEDHRLRYDSQERGLLRRALVTAIAREQAMDARPRGNADLLAPQTPTDPSWKGLCDIIGGPINGSVPKHPEITWREGVGVRLDWASDKLWLLLEPRIVFNGGSEETKAITADFARERTVRRYNPVLDKLIDFWSKRFAGSNLRAFGIGDGIDAVFDVSNKSAASWAAKP